MNKDELPELPKPAYVGGVYHHVAIEPAYTADQMREYALAAMQAGAPVAMRWPDGRGHFTYNDMNSTVTPEAIDTAEMLYLRPPATSEAEARLKRLAKALQVVAHTTNHCGVEHTALSETAEVVMREVLPDCEKITGNKCGVTIQSPTAEAMLAFVLENGLPTASYDETAYWYSEASWKGATYKTPQDAIRAAMKERMGS